MPESNLTKKAIALSAKELTKEKPYEFPSPGETPLLLSFSR